MYFLRKCKLDTCLKKFIPRRRDHIFCTRKHAKWYWKKYTDLGKASRKRHRERYRDKNRLWWLEYKKQNRIKNMINPQV